jgi:hypothetical protein
MPSNTSLQYSPPSLFQQRQTIVCSPADNAVNFEVVTLPRRADSLGLRLPSKAATGPSCDVRQLFKQTQLRLLGDAGTAVADWSADSWIEDMYAWNTRTPRECIVPKVERGRYRGFDVLP